MKVVCDVYLNDGNYAKIWVGMDDLNRKVAIKVMKEAGANVSTLEEHAEVLIRASHRNVVNVYSIEDVDIPEAGIKKSIIMEFIEGDTLDVYLNYEHNEHDLYDVGAQIIEGLEYIHNQGLVHMDLHEKNIMVTNDNHVKLIDIMYLSSLKNESRKTADSRRSRDFDLLKEVLTQLILASILGKDGVSEFEKLIASSNDLVEIKHAYHDVFTFACARCRIGTLFSNNKKGLEKLRLYKFRAECLTDVLQFMEQAKGKVRGYSIENDYIPDVEVEIVSSHSKSELLQLFENIIDAHVMIDTFESIHKYTGER